MPMPGRRDASVPVWRMLRLPIIVEMVLTTAKTVSTGQTVNHEHIDNRERVKTDDERGGQNTKVLNAGEWGDFFQHQ